MEQAKPLSDRSGKDFAIGSVRSQTFAVGEKLIPDNIARMVIRNHHLPLTLRHETRLSANLPVWCNLLARLASSEHISAGVTWIRQQAEHSRMSQSTPDQFAIPSAAVRSARKAEAELLETLNNAIGATLSLKQFEDCPNSALYFLVRIEDDLFVVENKTNR